jgi:hypothetical protein
MALERLRVDVKLSADFGSRMPAGLAFMLSEAADSIGLADPPYTQTSKALSGPGA